MDRLRVGDGSFSWLLDEFLPFLRRHKLTGVNSEESLPPYLKTTYTPETIVTVNQVLRSISENFTNHNSATPCALLAWDGDAPPKYMITCSDGVGNYHLSSKRDYTMPEFVCLQGFPLEHKFAGNTVKRRIGSPTPPCAADALYEEFVKHLKKVDGVQ